MTDPHFFGYGSLVNRDTHAYPHARPGLLQGWRREWVKTAERDVVYLSARRDPASRIAGLVAGVPGGNWAALDAREYGYDRHAVDEAVDHDPRARLISVYAVPEKRKIRSDRHVILLSYLDVVVQGFLREFGPQGVADFFETTDGWDTPILNDRASPRYSRHRALAANETAVVDRFLDRFGTRLDA